MKRNYIYIFVLFPIFIIGCRELQEEEEDKFAISPGTGKQAITLYAGISETADFNTNVSDSYKVTLEPAEGNADLFVYALSDNSELSLVDYSQNLVGPEVVEFTASKTKHRVKIVAVSHTQATIAIDAIEQYVFNIQLIDSTTYTISSNPAQIALSMYFNLSDAYAGNVFFQAERSIDSTMDIMSTTQYVKQSDNFYIKITINNAAEYIDGIQYNFWVTKKKVNSEITTENHGETPSNDASFSWPVLENIEYQQTDTSSDNIDWFQFRSLL